MIRSVVEPTCYALATVDHIRSTLSAGANINLVFSQQRHTWYMRQREPFPGDEAMSLGNVLKFFRSFLLRLNVIVVMSLWYSVDERSSHYLFPKFFLTLDALLLVCTSGYRIIVLVQCK